MTLHSTAKKMAMLGALAAAATSSGCGSQSDPQQSLAPDNIGTLQLALTVDGFTVDRVAITISSEDLDPAVVRARSLDVSNPRATVSAAEYGLPAGTYSVALSASVVDDPSTPVNEAASTCAGSVSGVAVSAGGVTPVTSLVLVCTIDGGQVRRAGGLSIDAEVEVERINQCPDLVQDLFIGPLETSVNGNVAISATLVEGATIAWRARAGTFSTDGTLYTCPAIAGTYPLTATITRADGCREQITRNVTCRGSFTGSCEALPSAFAFEGSCGLRSPCHITQNGCAWEANCRGQTFSGEGEGASFPFVNLTGAVCAASVVDGELVGTCGSGENACEFATNSAPPITVACEALPATITDVTACGVTYASCSVVQEACRYQANCDNGAAILNGVVTDDVLQWNFTRDGGNFRCEAPIVDGAVQGTCVQRNVPEPATCDDFSANVPRREGPVCEETLPEQPVVIEGCGLDSVCFPVQRGCAWALRCGGEYLGVASATNAFEFTSADGKACSGSVVDGSLTGSCQGEAESCAFATRAPVADAGCYAVPAQTSFSGCGLSFQRCDFVQDGCDVAIMCDDGAVFTSGQAIENGVAFTGTDSYQCQATQGAEGGPLRGQCTAPDGTNLGCETGIVLTPL